MGNQLTASAREILFGHRQVAYLSGQIMPIDWSIAHKSSVACLQMLVSINVNKIYKGIIPGWLALQQWGISGTPKPEIFRTYRPTIALEAPYSPLHGMNPYLASSS